MAFEPMKRRWNGTRAVLLVHGVGNAQAGQYADLVAKVRDALGPQSAEVAIYELYYDVFNDWAAAKFDLAGLLSQAVSLVRNRAAEELDDDPLATQIAETAGDVLLPAFSRSARAAVRDAFVAQLLRMVLDGRDAGVPRENQKLSIICHSLGCFHTFEVLHATAREPNYQLHPTLNATKFQNVIFMASPVQLIRTAFGTVGATIPGAEELATLSGTRLTQPGDPAEYAGSVHNWVSITGDLDPIGGHFLRRKAPWAYMEVEPQMSLIDRQQLGGDEQDEVTAKAMLLQVLKNASSSDSAPPTFRLENPHSWAGYIDRHLEEIGTWLRA